MSTTKEDEIKKNKQNLGSNYFNNLKEELKEKNYNNKSNTYIDTDIGEVLSIIKTRSKIGISSLLSFIVESWIEENKAEIDKLPTNKYMQ
ncbi:hypothetical protein [Tenacibaculum maritimum]|uniref:hypothetical protein n=1 Tax=Tenacibaculum maritimum TaxID=107401 RepID=UPI0038765667